MSNQRCRFHAKSNSVIVPDRDCEEPEHYEEWTADQLAAATARADKAETALKAIIEEAPNTKTPYGINVAAIARAALEGSKP